MNKEKIINKLYILGFTKLNNEEIFQKPIHNDEFLLQIYFNEQGQITDRLKDQDGNDYILYKIPSATGGYINEIRSEVENTINLLNDDFDDLSTDISQKDQVIEFIYKEYKNKPEYLWEDSPETAIFRNTKNKKWYALITKINLNKIKKNTDKEIDIINIKLRPEKVVELIDNQTFFPAWHMNKKHWITIRLDRKIRDSLLETLVRDSYDLVNK